MCASTPLYFLVRFEVPVDRMILNQKKNPSMDRVFKLSFREHVGNLSPTRSPISSPVPLLRSSSSGAANGSLISSSVLANQVLENKDSSTSEKIPAFDKDDPTADVQAASLRKELENLKIKHQLLLGKSKELENKNVELERRVAELESKTAEFKELQHKYSRLLAIQRANAEIHHSFGSLSPSSSMDELSIMDGFDSVGLNLSSTQSSTALIAAHHNVSVVRQHPSPDGEAQIVFAHSVSTPLGKKAMICRHFLKGRCRYKVNCKFSHDLKVCPHCNAALDRDTDQAAAHLADCWDRLHPSDK